MTIERRTVLRSGGAAALVGGPFAGALAHAEAKGRPTPRAGAPTADRRDEKVRLHLPPGLASTARSTTPSTPVFSTTDRPARPSRRHGRLRRVSRQTAILVRNHEINGPPGRVRPGHPYDAATGGGTTTIQHHADRRGPSPPSPASTAP